MYTVVYLFKFEYKLKRNYLKLKNINSTNNIPGSISHYSNTN